MSLLLLHFVLYGDSHMMQMATSHTHMVLLHHELLLLLLLQMSMLLHKMMGLMKRSVVISVHYWVHGIEECFLMHS